MDKIFYMIQFNLFMLIYFKNNINDETEKFQPNIKFGLY